MYKVTDRGPEKVFLFPSSSRDVIVKTGQIIRNLIIYIQQCIGYESSNQIHVNQSRISYYLLAHEV